MRGYEVNKKTVDRERHIVVDTPTVRVHISSWTPSANAVWFEHVFADCAMTGPGLSKVTCRDFVLEVVRRTDRKPGLKMPRRR